MGTGPWTIQVGPVQSEGSQQEGGRSVRTRDMTVETKVRGKQFQGNEGSHPPEAGGGSGLVLPGPPGRCSPAGPP